MRYPGGRRGMLDTSLLPEHITMRESSDVTRILNEFDARPDAADALLPMVYDELRAIAQNRMREERAGHTLQATALVHEVYVKLVGGGRGEGGDGEDGGGPSWESRGHFFRVAAEAMRRILIDHARRRASLKRGGNRRSIPLSVADLSEEHDPGSLIAMDEALATLETEDPRAADIVKLRFFAGLSVEEVKRVLDVSERTVMRDWSFARARLFQLLGDAVDPAPGEDGASR